VIEERADQLRVLLDLALRLGQQAIGDLRALELLLGQAISSARALHRFTVSIFVP